MKTPFVTKDQLEAIAVQYPTPFHIYDEKGIRENARRLRAAFAWNPGYREYFAVKATPTPVILKILHEEGCGCDCSSLAELVMAERCGVASRIISLGFTPKALLVSCTTNGTQYSGDCFGGLVTPGIAAHSSRSVGLKIVDGGFEVYNYPASSVYTNGSAYRFVYLAFR